jgi:hypothetical protein
VPIKAEKILAINILYFELERSEGGRIWIKLVPGASSQAPRNLHEILIFALFVCPDALAVSRHASARGFSRVVRRG